MKIFFDVVQLKAPTCFANIQFHKAHTNKDDSVRAFIFLHNNQENVQDTLSRYEPIERLEKKCYPTNSRCFPMGKNRIRNAFLIWAHNHFKQFFQHFVYSSLLCVFWNNKNLTCCLVRKNICVLCVPKSKKFVEFNQMWHIHSHNTVHEYNDNRNIPSFRSLLLLLMLLPRSWICTNTLTINLKKKSTAYDIDITLSLSLSHKERRN